MPKGIYNRKQKKACRFCGRRFAAQGLPSHEARFCPERDTVRGSIPPEALPLNINSLTLESVVNDFRDVVEGVHDDLTNQLNALEEVVKQLKAKVA